MSKIKLEEIFIGNGTGNGLHEPLGMTKQEVEEITKLVLIFAYIEKTAVLSMKRIMAYFKGDMTQQQVCAAMFIMGMMKGGQESRAQIIISSDPQQLIARIESEMHELTHQVANELGFGEEVDNKCKSMSDTSMDKLKKIIGMDTSESLTEEAEKAIKDLLKEE